MVSLKPKRRCTLRLLAAIGAAPILLWIVVLLVAPTGWARARIVRQLEETTGRHVSIDSIRLGMLGNMRIRGIAVANGSLPDDPWLKVAEARLDVSLFRLLTHRCQPKEIALDGVDLRVLRRADGSLEFADILAPRRASGGAAQDSGSRPEVKLTIHGAHLSVADEPNSTRFELEEVEGKATWDGRVANIELLHGQINGGTFAFAALYDRSTASPAFQAEARLNGVALGPGLKAVGLLVPVVSDVASSIDGRIDFKIALNGRGSTLDAIKPGLKGHGSIRILPIDMTGSKLLGAIDGHHPIPRAGRLGSVESHFAIESGRIRTDDLTMTIALLPITLAGWTDFDGRIDYAFKPEALRNKLAAKLPPEARQLLGEIRDELGELADLHIVGTVDAPKLVAGGMDASGRGRSVDERARLQQAARKLKQKYLR